MISNLCRRGCQCHIPFPKWKKVKSEALGKNALKLGILRFFFFNILTKNIRITLHSLTFPYAIL